jgi:hypothetical protein
MVSMLSMAAPLVTDLRQADELLVLCSSLGMRDKDEGSPSVYHRGDEARGKPQLSLRARTANPTSSTQVQVHSATLRAFLPASTKRQPATLSSHRGDCARGHITPSHLPLVAAAYLVLMQLPLGGRSQPLAANFCQLLAAGLANSVLCGQSACPIATHSPTPFLVPHTNTRTNGATLQR